jgi:5-methylcytosine-specific restriction protein A
MADPEEEAEGGPPAVRRRIAFEELVPNASVVMGVKAVFARLTSRVMCFGGRGSPEQHGRYYQAARTAAERATDGQRFLFAIGGGDEVPDELRRRLVNLAVVSGVYGKTDAFLNDPEERGRLAQWPTAVALNDVWEFEDLPHLINDLGFPDGRILENAFDSVIRPEERVEKLVAALRGRMLVLKDLPPILDFRDEGKVTIAITRLPRKVSAEEGKRLYGLATKLERDRGLVAAVKDRNRAANGGLVTCECCGFADAEASYLDAHHLVPLVVEVRISTLQDFAVLCPTCHRVVHRKGASMALPLPIADLREWWKARI